MSGERVGDFLRRYAWLWCGGALLALLIWAAANPPGAGMSSSLPTDVGFWHRQRPPRPVRHTFARDFCLYGRLTPYTDLEVRAPAAGLLERNKVKVGDKVTAGEILSYVFRTDALARTGTGQPAPIAAAVATVEQDEVKRDVAAADVSEAAADSERFQRALQDAQDQLTALEKQVAAARQREQPALPPPPPPSKTNDLLAQLADQRVHRAETQLAQLKQREDQSKAAVSVASQRLAAATDEATRSKHLFDLGVIARNKVETAETDRDTAEKALHAAQKTADAVHAAVVAATAEVTQARDALAAARVEKPSAVPAPTPTRAPVSATDIAGLKQKASDLAARIDSVLKQLKSARADLTLKRQVLQTANAELTTAQRQLAVIQATEETRYAATYYSAITASAAGTVTAVVAEPGRSVALNQTVFLIRSDAAPAITASFEPAFLSQVQSWQIVDVIVLYPHAKRVVTATLLGAHALAAEDMAWAGTPCIARFRPITPFPPLPPAGLPVIIRASQQANVPAASRPRAPVFSVPPRGARPSMRKETTGSATNVRRRG